MDEWNTRQHGRSGLTERVRQSTLDAADANGSPWVPPLARDPEYLHVWQQHLPGPAFPGPSEMPAWKPSLLPNLDVSSLKIWPPRGLAVLAGVAKSTTHLSLADIYDSIADLRHYREHLLKPEFGVAGHG